VARLIAKTPLEGVLPVAAEGAALSETLLDRAVAIAPFRGKERAVSGALKELGLGFPAPGKTSHKGEARIIWWGRGQALLIGAPPPVALDGIAALTEQADGLAALRLEGPCAEAALARLVPLDLRATAFPRGATARTMLYHMTCSVTRVGPQAFEILVMRSMGRTAVHDLTVAMKSVAAQA
jgi:heterotetrameric sarcosine oxidase gamma subunit